MLGNGFKIHYLPVCLVGVLYQQQHRKAPCSGEAHMRFPEQGVAVRRGRKKKLLDGG
jgi:hypothetical protein